MKIICTECDAQSRHYCVHDQDQHLYVVNKSAQVVHMSRADLPMSHPVAPGQTVVLNGDFECVWRSQA